GAVLTESLVAHLSNTQDLPYLQLFVKKLIIQIPCLNEAATLPATLADLPRSVPGIDVIEILVIDNGPLYQTADVARRCNVDHIVSFRRNKGLAAAFMAGIDAALKA